MLLAPLPIHPARRHTDWSGWAWDNLDRIPARPEAEFSEVVYGDTYTLVPLQGNQSAVKVGATLCTAASTRCAGVHRGGGVLLHGGVDTAGGRGGVQPGCIQRPALPGRQRHWQLELADVHSHQGRKLLLLMAKGCWDPGGMVVTQYPLCSVTRPSPPAASRTSTGTTPSSPAPPPPSPHSALPLPSTQTPWSSRKLFLMRWDGFHDKQQRNYWGFYD